MSSPRRPSIVPCQHIADGRTYRPIAKLVTADMQRRWNTYLEKRRQFAPGHQPGPLTAGSSQSTQAVGPQIHDAPSVEHLIPTSAHNPGTSLEDSVSGGNQDHVEGRQHRHLPPVIRHNGQPALEEEHIQIRYPEAKSERGKRRRKPEFESALAKKKAAVHGGAGANRGPRGQVRTNTSGLEYWMKDTKRWVPAVQHSTIRKKLIDRAKAGERGVYEYPRAHGAHELDITAFLGSQKDWDLERDNGWSNITNEVLYMFAKRDHETPPYVVSWMYDEGRVVLDRDHHPIKDYRDIPLACSSKIEGALMEAIRRLDPRITILDFWARIPDDCGKGDQYTTNALNARMSRFRLENSCPAWTERRGTRTLRQYIWDRMSTAARDANSTRELSKLSKEEQREARRPNAGKFDANAGGWALKKEDRGHEEGAPTSLRSGKNKRPQPDSDDDDDDDNDDDDDEDEGEGEDEYNGNNEHQQSLTHSQRGNYSIPNQRQRAAPHGIQELTQSAIYIPQNPYMGMLHGDISSDPSLHPGPADHDYGPTTFSSSQDLSLHAPMQPQFPLPDFEPNSIDASHDMMDAGTHHAAAAQISPREEFDFAEYLSDEGLNDVL